MEIKTAEEALKENDLSRMTVFYDKHQNQLDGDNLISIMIEFAKMHCQAQKEVIIEKAKVKKREYFNSQSVVWKIDEDSIINAYPLDNIK